jgi:hypothetical protein
MALLIRSGRCGSALVKALVAVGTVVVLIGLLLPAV